MMHGLLLNIFKSSVALQFSSIEGYLLTAGNFALTVGLCAVVSPSPKNGHKTGGKS